jgi:hypothetical protein
MSYPTSLQHLDILLSGYFNIAYDMPSSAACCRSAACARAAAVQPAVRLAPAVCLHSAVALELVAGQMWATLQPVQLEDCGTFCPGGKTPGSGPSGQLVVPPRLLGELGRFGLGRLEPRPQDQRHRHPVKDGEGGLRAGLGRPGQTSRQPDVKSSATLAGPSLLQARAWLKRGAGLQWGNPGRRPGAGGLIA